MTRLGGLLLAHPVRARVAVGTLVGLYLVLVVFDLGGNRQVLSNIAQCIAALAAAIMAWSVVRFHPPHTRRIWRLFALSAGSWGTGQAIWTWYELFGGDNVPFPSLSDVGYLPAVPFALAAVTGFINTPSGRIAWLRAALEGGVIAAALLFLSWAAVLGPVYRNGADTVLAQVISLAYPFSDVVIISLVIYAGCRARPGHRLTLAYVGAALVLLSMADCTFAVLSVRGTYQTGSVSDLGWLGGYLLIGLASLRVQQPTAATAVDQSSVLARIASFIPLAPLFLALALVVSGAVDPRHDVVLGLTALAVVVLLGLMELVTLLDNAVLTAFLESRVAERTADYHRRERFFRSIVQKSSDMVSVVDEHMTVLYQTSSGLAVQQGEVDGALTASRSILDMFDETQRPYIEAAIVKVRQNPHDVCTIEVAARVGRHSKQILELTVMNLLEDDDVRGIVVTTSDITDRKSLEEQLTHQAFHDSLTTLPNRALFQDRVAHATKRLERDPDQMVAVLFIDLDGFKSVNDSMGHAAGDLLLQGFAERVQRVLRPGSTFARLGGDEFAVLVEDCTDARTAARVADRILADLLAPFELFGRDIFVNASIGIATGDVAASVEELLRNADVAMYMAKADGSGRHRLYEPQMHSDAVARLELESGLRRAVENNEFVLNYQPLVSLEDNRVVGLEALVRWNHPTLGMVPPDRFIPLAEQTGLILPIGRWVLLEACRGAMAWCTAYGDDAPHISVNLSYRQLQDPTFIDDLARVLFDTGLPPAMLTLELTESLLADNGGGDALVKLQAIKDLGVSLSIDDFGTGYSSLSYLRQFPFDELKIDRRFIAALATDSEDFELVQAILGLGELFKLSTVAEGIETAEQGDTLRRMGCTVGQGFHFARPMARAQLETFMGLPGGDGFVITPPVDDDAPVTSVTPLEAPRPA